jgi:hypothetical protein
VDKTQLFEAQDVLYPSTKKKKYEEVVTKFHESLVKLSQSMPKCKFDLFKKGEHIWNMYALPFETSSLKQLKIDTLKATQGNNEIDMTRIPNDLVTQGVFISLNYISAAKLAVSDSQKSQRMSRFQNLSLVQPGTYSDRNSKSESPQNMKRISLAVHFAK